MVPYINVRCYIKARLILPMFPRNFAGQSKCFILSTKKYGFSNPGRIRVLGSNGDVITTLQLPEDHEFSTHRVTIATSVRLVVVEIMYFTNRRVGDILAFADLEVLPRSCEGQMHASSINDHKLDVFKCLLNSPPSICTVRVNVRVHL